MFNFTIFAPNLKLAISKLDTVLVEFSKNKATMILFCIFSFISKDTALKSFA